MNALAEALPPEPSYNQGRQFFECTAAYLDSKEAFLKTHSELEREMEKRSRELMLLLLQEHLDRRGPGQCKEPVTDSEGVERSRLRLQERKLETVFGTLSEMRAGYGGEGVKILHPLDAELNLPKDRYSLELRRRMWVPGVSSCVSGLR